MIRVGRSVRDLAARVYHMGRRVALNNFSPQLSSPRNRDYWERTKGLHEGQRGFVIGNGPSLRFEDLDRLGGEVTIASNKVFLAYSETDWRPMYYTISDKLVAKKLRDQLHEYVESVHVPIDIGQEFTVPTYYWKARVAPKAPPGGSPWFSDDARRGFHGGYSITYENLQLAAHLGLNPIYLLGVDHSYSGETGKRKVGTVATTDATNHFIPGYRKKGEIVNTAALDRITLAFRHARAYSRETDVRILNATRGGALEVFERVSFDELFS